jgi:hypothetical protein
MSLQVNAMISPQPNPASPGDSTSTALGDFDLVGQLVSFERGFRVYKVQR